MLELFYFPTATCGIKVRLLLDEKGIEFTPRVLNREAGDLRKPEYLKLNPKGVVPTLVHDGNVITESTIIMNYLEDVFPQPALRPADPLSRARIGYWLKQIDEVYFAAIGTLSYATVIRARMLKEKAREEIDQYFDSSPNPSVARGLRTLIEKGVEAPGVKAAVRALDKMVDAVDQRGGDGPFLVGDSYSMADAAVTPFVERLERLGLDSLWRSRRNAAQWWEAIKSRPSYSNVVAADQPEPVLRQMLEAGTAAKPVIEGYLQ